MNEWHIQTVNKRNVKRCATDLYTSQQQQRLSVTHAPGVLDNIYGMSFRNVSIARPKLIWNSARSFAICCRTGGKFVPIVSDDVGKWSTALVVSVVDSSSTWWIEETPPITPLRCSDVTWNASTVDDNNTTRNDTINVVMEWFIVMMMFVDSVVTSYSNLTRNIIE